ncbi:MAG: FtsX-like permease family protein, partial [Deltaproteobacteria bacterium]|nr:FtsX-like permease family protein [Deltaproteobacteria bacterium]
LKRLPWVDEVQYSREWVEKFASLIRFMELAALVIGVFLAAATVFIVSNTVRLAVYARREEIEIMRLIGASDTYVKVPFFMEGVMQGVVGGLISFAVLAVGRYLILDNVPQYFRFALDVPFPAPAVFSVLALSGVLMGVAGSLVTVGRFLKT